MKDIRDSKEGVIKDIKKNKTHDVKLLVPVCRANLADKVYHSKVF